MAQIFHRSFNAISKASIFGALFLLTAVAWVWAAVQESPWVTEAGVVRDQPVHFSHEHHAGQLGIDCRYCHATYEWSAYAGMPPTKTCMSCHSQLYTRAPLLEPVRESWRTGLPIAWTRVHDLPDFVYFDHSIHVARGVACADCHGDVESMPLLAREHTLLMTWCLDCHREPEKHVAAAARGAEVPARAPTDCTACHR